MRVVPREFLSSLVLDEGFFIAIYCFYIEIGREEHHANEDKAALSPE